MACSGAPRRKHRSSSLVAARTLRALLSPAALSAAALRSARPAARSRSARSRYRARVARGEPFDYKRHAARSTRTRARRATKKHAVFGSSLRTRRRRRGRLRVRGYASAGASRAGKPMARSLLKSLSNTRALSMLSQSRQLSHQTTN